MQDGVVGVLLSPSLVGCLNLGPGSTGTRSYAQLGWVCGVDDTGGSCGSYVAPQACSVGSCVDPGAQVIASGATAFAGGYSVVLFILPAAATVRFNASSPGLFQAGVFTLSDWTLFASGRASGAFVLTNPSPSAIETLRPGAGTYILGPRCASAVGSCLIRYGINATY